MKILRAIGHFFAKIGRWIASTAWVQPLLIVGGIFAIIFSIPYIKRGIEGLVNKETDTEYDWYSSQKLSLKEGAEADKLLGYLELNEDGEYDEKIKKEFGASKFILTFVQKECQACKSAYSGYQNAIVNGFVPNFKMFTILVDETKDNGDKLITDVYIKHNDLFDQLNKTFGLGATDDNVPLFRNLNKIGKNQLVETLKKTTDELEGAAYKEKIETPITFLVDLDKNLEAKQNGITQIIYSISDLDFSTEQNEATKGEVIRNLWNYYDIFDPNYKI